MRLQRIVDELPADFDTVRAEARAEGYRFLDRLESDWASGAMRFDRPGEALLAAYSEGVLAAIGGIKCLVEPGKADDRHRTVPSRHGLECRIEVGAKIEPATYATKADDLGTY